MEDSQARAILRENGETPPVRGKLGAEWIEKAEGYRDGYIEPPDPPDLGAPPEDPDPAAHNGQPPEDPPDAEPPPMAPERPPRRPRAGRSATPPKWREKIWGKRSGSRQRQGRSQPKQARISVDKLCATAWRGMAAAFGYLDEPISKVLALQAPVAGLILEDTIRGTFLDVVLQPVAQMQETAGKLSALAGPPVLVALIEACQGLPEPQRQIRLALLFPMLEASLMSWYHVAGDRAAQLAERAENEEPARNFARANIAVIFASRLRPPPEETQAEQAQRHADDNPMRGVFV